MNQIKKQLMLDVLKNYIDVNLPYVDQNGCTTKTFDNKLHLMRDETILERLDSQSQLKPGYVTSGVSYLSIIVRDLSHYIDFSAPINQSIHLEFDVESGVFKSQEQTIMEKLKDIEAEDIITYGPSGYY